MFILIFGDEVSWILDIFSFIFKNQFLFPTTLTRLYITFTIIIKYQNGHLNIKLSWNHASNYLICTLNAAEHFLRSFITTLGRFYITLTTITEYQNGYLNIKLGCTCASNDFTYISEHAEHFLMSFPTTLSRFYITFFNITEYQNDYQNIKGI